MGRVAPALLLAVAIAGCTAGGSGASQRGADDGLTSSTSPTTRLLPSGTGCRATYPDRRLPAWATTGFSGPRPSAPYVLGDAGQIAAIMFISHHPLSAPPVAGQNNKILWAARVGAVEGPLQIRASLPGAGTTVTRTVDPAPGPSIIDLPSPGCWSFDLTWGSHHDHLRLGYLPG